MLLCCAKVDYFFQNRRKALGTGREGGCYWKQRYQMLFR